MAWPADFDPPSREALILVPNRRAHIQDLGPVRTGRAMETDILPGSALVCAAEAGRPVIGPDGRVRFAFEGNAIGAVNLGRFHERCLCAAGRLATRAPSIAYGTALAADLRPVARYDLLRYVFTEILDAQALESWCGEALGTFLPPADLSTPTTDGAVMETLCRLPMRPIAQGRNGLHLWLLCDGTVLSLSHSNPDAKGTLTAWRRGDAGLSQLLEDSGIGPAQRILLLS